MAVRRADWESQPEPLPPPSLWDRPTVFGPLVAYLRKRTGLSQNQLARRAGVDPAYVNRLERAKPGDTSLPSRRVVIALYETLRDAAASVGVVLGSDDRERLLVAAGHCPEVILLAGGWDAYTRRLRRAVIDSAGVLVDTFSAALDGTEEAR